MEDSQEIDDQNDAATPIPIEFVPPSIDRERLLSGESYSYFSAIPKVIADDPSLELVLGVDEAGRGPVLGPMVYGVFFLPLNLHWSLLAETHHFDDSKVLTPATRARLMEQTCTPGTDLYDSCGWATRVMSARDISAGQLKPVGAYNLNAQAMDATVDLIQKVLDSGMNIKEIYVDTIGRPDIYQKKLERIFPTATVSVAIKADSLFPCVSAASVCAKVTRDVALNVSYESYGKEDDSTSIAVPAWGSGYPGDAKCSRWLKSNKDPLFGWGSECRFSWQTAKDLLDKDRPKVRWPEPDDDDDNMKLTHFSAFANETASKEDELASWFGTRCTQQVF